MDIHISEEVVEALEEIRNTYPQENLGTVEDMVNAILNAMVEEYREA